MKFKKANHELEMKYLSVEEDIDTLNPAEDYNKLPTTDSFKWSINGTLDIEIKDKFGNSKFVGKTSNSQIEKINNYYLIKAAGASTDGHAFLLSAPNSSTFGCKEPRAYLDVDKLTNYSTYNSNGKDAQDYIKTTFSRVRLISIRNKKGEMVDKIDLSDFKFAEGNKKFKIEIVNQSHVFVDAAPYGVAMSNNIQHLS